MSLETAKELLNKHKLVESMVQNQLQPRKDVVETLVHRQHLVALEELMAKLSANEVGNILEALPIEDALLVWTIIPEDRENDILWEVSDTLREKLAGSVEPDFRESQISAFTLVDGKLHQIDILSRKNLEDIKPIWIDLLNASAAQRAYVGDHFKVSLPDPGDAIDLEVSSRFHVEENDEIHLRANFLLNKEGESRSVPVAFVLHEGILFSQRNEELPVFRLQRRRMRTRIGYVSDCFDLLLDLFGADVEYSADSLENIYKILNKVSKQVLNEGMPDKEAAIVLSSIGEEEDLNGRIRSDILDTQRALIFLMQIRVLSHNQQNDAKQILRNIESLNSHTAFLFDKINFLMDATIGFININQNKRVNQLTFFGVVFMPINILAGIGGMSEFSMMTRGIPWPISYGAFVIAMGFLGWGMYVALKHFEAKQVKKLTRRI